MNEWLNDEGMKKYMTDAISGVIDDKTFDNMRQNAVLAGGNIGITLSSDGADIHKQFGTSKGTIGDLERSIYSDEQRIESIKVEKAKLGDEFRRISERESVVKANSGFVKK